MSQGKALTPDEIEDILTLSKSNCSERTIQAITGICRKTIRKVRHSEIRRVDGDLTKPYHIRGTVGDKYESPIDEEVLYIQEYDGYYRILGGEHDRESLHVYEAKKVYKLCGLDWPEDANVHHIDNLKINNSLENLSVMTKGGHQRQHTNMEKAMYNFLWSHNLLVDFYEENPQLKCVSLADLIVATLQELQEDSQ